MPHNWGQASDIELSIRFNASHVTEVYVLAAIPVWYHSSLRANLWQWVPYPVPCHTIKDEPPEPVRFNASQLGVNLWHWIAYPVQRLTCDQGCIYIHEQPGLQGEIPVWFHSLSLTEVASTLMNLLFPHTAMPHGATFCNAVPYCAPQRICIMEPWAVWGWGRPKGLDSLGRLQ
jgi:hypothetical protein